MADSWRDGGGVPATPEPGKPRCGASLVKVKLTHSAASMAAFKPKARPFSLEPGEVGDGLGAARVGDPRFPLQRFSGVLAPGSSWRRDVVAMCPRPAATHPAHGEPPKPTSRPRKKKATNKNSGDAASGSLAVASRSNLPPSGVSPSHITPADLPPDSASPRPHTSLGEGLPLRWTGRHDWVTLLRRVTLDDVLACRCRGRRTIVADIFEPNTIRDILEHLELPSQPHPIATARDPDEHAA